MAVELFDFPLSPPCRSVKVLANQIGIDLQINNIDLMAGDQRTSDYLKVNPFGTVPAITDDGFNLFDSRAIMIYLVNKFAPESKLYPKDGKERSLVDSILSYDATHFSTSFSDQVATIISTGKDVEDWMKEKGRDNLKCLDNHLASRKYVAGNNLTLADISVIHSLSYPQILSEDFSSYTNVLKYIKFINQELGSFYSELNDNAVTQFRGFLKMRMSS